ncbi:MAG: leucine-rich repeat domain-containing protein [Bacilli bacterium]|nr:leucine-rich repeat domain-containing protein [Bacilli bacterium]
MNGPEFVVVPQQKNKTSKRRKIIAIISISLSLLVLIGGAYASLIYYVLLDYVTMPYITFSYRSDLADESQITVTIDKVNHYSDYPARFRIPRKLMGYPVTAIGPSAFAGLERIEEVIIPDSVELIGEYAFANCSSLRKFNSPTGIRRIGTDAFLNTPFLLESPDGPIEIGPFLYTYKGDIPENTYILVDDKSEAYDPDNKDFNYFFIGEYSRFSDGVFMNQDGIVYVEIPSSVEEIPNQLFKNCQNLAEVHLNDSVTIIGNEAFSGATSLLEIEWSEFVVSVGDYAFKDTNFTGEVSLGINLVEIGEGAFQNSKEMTKITIPAGVTTIKNYVFDGCENLSEIILEDREFSTDSKITAIGTAAFRGTAISEFTIPFSVRSLQDNTFENCPNLTSVFIYNNIEGTERIEYSTDEEGQMVENFVKHGLTKIGLNAFNNSSAFKELVLVDQNNQVENATLRNVVSMPVTLTQLGEQRRKSNIFSGTAAEVLNLNIKGLSFVANSLAENATSLREILFYNNPADESEGIKTINANAFSGCTSLVGVNGEMVIPNSVETMGANVFMGCSSLTSVTLPSNAKYLTIDTGTFKDCSSLTEITIGGNIVAIKERSFENCTSLTAITIPSSVKTMGANVFNGCDNSLQITVMTHNDNTANWNSQWLGTSGLTVEANVTYVPE